MYSDRILVLRDDDQRTQPQKLQDRKSSFNRAVPLRRVLGLLQRVLLHRGRPEECYGTRGREEHEEPCLRPGAGDRDAQVAAVHRDPAAAQQACVGPLDPGPGRHRPPGAAPRLPQEVRRCPRQGVLENRPRGVLVGPHGGRGYGILDGEWPACAAVHCACYDRPGCTP